MLLIGLDEAGYGPTLGPLCHGFAAFRVSDALAAPPDLWDALAAAVSRSPRDPNRIAIADSKALHIPGKGLLPLADGLGAMLAQLQPRASFSMRDILIPEDCAQLEADPWGRPAADAEPAYAICPAKDAALASALKTNGISLVALGSRALPARSFNALLAKGLNKADVNWSVCSRQLAALFPCALPDERIEVVIDRMGGRKFYAAQLTELCQGVLPSIEQEDAAASVYRFSQGPHGGPLRVSFLVGAEQRSLPVALASMAAKFTRECAMNRFNAFFLRSCPTLSPTAGYPVDAARFISETSLLRKELQISDDALIRLK